MMRESARTLLQKICTAQRIPGASAAVLQGGAQEVGYANVEHDVPATADTVYEIASIRFDLLEVV